MTNVFLSLHVVLCIKSWLARHTRDKLLATGIHVQQRNEISAQRKQTSKEGDVVTHPVQGPRMTSFFVGALYLVC